LLCTLGVPVTQTGFLLDALAGAKIAHAVSEFRPLFAEKLIPEAILRPNRRFSPVRVGAGTRWQ
jgi:hypothetical protein